MRLVRIAAVAFTFAAVLAACGSSGSKTSSTATTTGSSSAPTTAAPSGSSATINSAQTPLGTVLVDAQGKTLYHLTKESATNITCTGQCASTWPPAAVPAGQKPQAGSGVTATLTAVMRPDGSQQAAANGYPLYTYSGDTKAGDTHGQGVGGIWFAVMANGTSTGAGAAGSTATTTPATTKTTLGNGY